MDVPLVLQVLTDVALETDLWTSAGGTAESVYHAAAVHTYRTVAGLNALAGRTGSPDFVALPTTTEENVGRSWGHILVSRGETTLGVISSIQLLPWSEYLLEVFALSGTELAAAVPRLQQLAALPELGMPGNLARLLRNIADIQLAVIDRNRAMDLTPTDFAQVSDRPVERFPLTPEVDNQVLRPLAPATLAPYARLTEGEFRHRQPWSSRVDDSTD